MHCPICNTILKKLDVTTVAGVKFAIDHCGNCGGTWFDAFEINRIPYHEVIRIAKNTVLPKKLSNRPTILHCPKDHKKLALFNSESLPAGIEMHRCHTCGGYWATQKGLEILKQLEEERVVHFSKKRAKYHSISAIVWPASFLVLLLAFSFVTFMKLEEQQITRTQATELVTNLTISPITSTAVTVSFQTKIPLRSSISYGKTLLDRKTMTISTVPSTTHARILIGLEIYQTYIFHINLTDENNRIFTTPNSTLSTGK